MIVIDFEAKSLTLQTYPIELGRHRDGPEPLSADNNAVLVDRTVCTA
jgi:hypothetical protein